VAHTTDHAELPKLETPHATAHAPTHTAPKVAVAAPKAALHAEAAMPKAPHQPAYKPKPMATPAEHMVDTSDVGGNPNVAPVDATEQEHTVAVPKRVPAARTEVASGGVNGYYKDRSGDTLSSIAYRYLGSASLWPEVHAANREAIKNPHFIRVGQRIALPSAPAHMAKVHRHTSTHYVVKPGDSLSRIAKEQMGDVGQWQRIFAANRSAIANPRFIYPGQRLTIPG
jgi:nucleoid-associated protein YgaU